MGRGDSIVFQLREIKYLMTAIRLVYIRIRLKKPASVDLHPSDKDLSGPSSIRLRAEIMVFPKSMEYGCFQKRGAEDLGG